MKTLAFAGSNSSQSINHQLVSYAASLCKDVEILKLTDYPLPIYSIDLQNKDGIPENVKTLNGKIANADHIIISVCEHNGSMSAFFKNTLDWLSRQDKSFLKEKKITLLSTSPGAAGAASALAQTQKMLPYFGAEVISATSVGSFNDHYNPESGFDQEIQQLLQGIIQ